jgi:hydroxyacylglutathione hydrolase
MNLSILGFAIGPMGNNSYLVADEATHEAVVIDPSFDSQLIQTEADRLGYHITAIWLTHAHFDHMAGVADLAYQHSPTLPVGMHPAELALYHNNGGASAFGLEIPAGPEPTIFFEHGQTISIGNQKLEVRHTPGHTPGHVVFYSKEAGVVFCGDLIFQGGIGRTDLPGGSFATLSQSIQTQIFTLPPETQLLSGHGADTTVEDEMEN